MAYVLGEPTVQQYFDANGDPLTLGTIEFYIWNTSTPTPIYSDSTGTSAGTSVTLDSLGAPSNGGTPIALFFDDSVTYKIVRKDSAGTPIDPTIGPYQVKPGADYITAVDSGAADSLYDYVGTEDGRQAFVAGYYTAGDGGGGTFYWDAASTDADDGGVTILPTGHVGAGRWKRIITDNINAKMFGALSDGVNDDAASFSAAVDYAIASNKTLLIIGLINLSAWTVKSISGALNILGENQPAKIIGNTSNLLSLADGSSFSAKSVAFEDIGQLLVLSATGNYPLIELNGVKYTNSGPVVATGCLDVDTLRVQDCEFDIVTDACFSMSSYIKYAIFTGNKFTNLSSATSSCSALTLGKTQLVDQPLTGNYIVSENLFENIIAGGASSGEVHAMVLYGDRATITGNIVNNIDRPLSQQSGGVEGIYTKTANTTITGNSLFNAGFAEGNKGAMINVKGESHNSASGRPLGINHVVSNNTIGCDDALSRNGIRVETDYASVTGNTFEGINGAFAIGVSWPNDGSEGLVIANNIITNSTLVNGGIWLNTIGKKIRVNDNLIANDGVSGGFDGAIFWTDAERASGSMDDICIDNNIISGSGWDYGIIFNNATGRDLSNIRVFDNKITGTVYGIRTNNPTRILSGEIKRNQMVGVAVAYRDKAIDTVRYVDNTNDNLNIDTRTAAPTTGTWTAGEIVYSSQPATTGFIGWVCTAGGTPGTWKTFGVVTP